MSMCLVIRTFVLHDATETTKTPVTTAVASGCPKCGSLKSGKSSCCGRGGAWFGKCADEVNDKFDHTWVEGISECKSADVARAQAKKLQAIRGTETPKQDTVGLSVGATIDGYADPSVSYNLAGSITVLFTITLGI